MTEKRKLGGMKSLAGWGCMENIKDGTGILGYEKSPRFRAIDAKKRLDSVWSLW